MSLSWSCVCVRVCICLKAFNVFLHVLMYIRVINEYKCVIVMVGKHTGVTKTTHKLKVYMHKTHGIM